MPHAYENFYSTLLLLDLLVLLRYCASVQLGFHLHLEKVDVLLTHIYMYIVFIIYFILILHLCRIAF